MTILERAFAINSPRLSPRRLSPAGWLIHLAVVLLWVVLFAQALRPTGISFWSTGIAYTLYDTLLLAFVAWQTLPLLGKAPTQAASSHRPSLGIVVAAWNEAAGLPAMLQCLLEQSDKPDVIIIADDGSSDGTATLLSGRFGLPTPATGSLGDASPLHPNLRWLRLPHGGKARALNTALLTLDTEVVLTVDADTLLDANATAAMRAAFAGSPRLAAASGILTPIAGRSPGNRFFQWMQTYEYVRNFVSRYAWMRLDSLLLISGAFAGFRRDALLAVGGFDPDCLVEDYELVHRIQRHARDHHLDWQVQMVGRAHARTEAPGNLPDFLRQRRRWFGGFLQTQYWNRDMTGNARYGWLGLAMLPVKAIDTLQPVFGITAFVLLMVLLATGNVGILIPVAGIIAAKTLLDLVFHLWTIRLYRRWTGLRHTTHAGQAVLAALAEPFSFQLLRHAGAALGWLQFLTRRQTWGLQRRTVSGG